MIFKYIKSNKGSTLVMVILIISILSILGMALLSLSFMNLRMKRMDENIKNSFYWSESCIDEAYAITCKVVQQAIEDGNTYVSNELVQLLTSQRMELENKTAEDEVQDTEYLNADGTVKQAKLEGLFNNWFKAGFNDAIAASNIYYMLSTKSSYNTIDESKDIIISIANPEAIDSDNNHVIDQHRFTVVSTYKENKVSKTVKARFQINVPDYNTPMIVNTNIVQLSDNILWDKVIASDKNIYVLGDDVNIDGNVFARGEKPADLTKSRDFGGIVVGLNSKSGRLSITGNVATDSYFHANASSSNINVTGNVYCDSLVVQDGISGANININGQVSTKDDLELNGSASTIAINGDYYGFSDGSSVQAGHDESSSIVFNSIDLGINSWLRVTGKAYIGGTVYINTVPNKYQTGESVAFKRSPNYLAYGYRFLEQDRDKLNTMLLSQEELNKYLGLYSRFNSENILFEFYEPLYVADKFVNPSEEKLNVFDKRDYIYLYNLIYPDRIYKGTNVIDDITRSGVFLPGMVYSAGTYVDNGVLKTKDFLLQYKEEYEEPQKEAYRKYVNHMGDSEEAGSVDKEADKVYIYERFNFSGANIIPNEFEVNQRKELVLVDNSGNPLELIGPDGVDSVAGVMHRQYNIYGERYKGLILTTGDVYISGKIDFEGTILTTGNIYILDGAQGQQTKRFKSNISYVKHKIIENNLINRFINNYGSPKPFVYESNIFIDSDGNSYIASNNIVKIISWKKE